MQTIFATFQINTTFNKDSQKQEHMYIQYIYLG